MLRVYVLFSILFSAIRDTRSQEAGTKRVEEVEDEIGYVQSLMLNTPPLASLKSSYQDIEVYESSHFGKVFLLDECLQLTERDAPHYNEMLAHVPMMEYLASHRGDSDSDSETEADSELEPMRVLVIGGGDGYVVSELLKHPHIESIDHVELDEEVINVSKRFFEWASAWEHEKVNLIIGNGATFVEDQLKKKEAGGGISYHVIIQDASDPFYTDSNGSIVILPSHVLYQDEHFQRMHKLLAPNRGVLMFQAETYNIPSNLEEIRNWRRSLEQIGFEHVRYGSISISTYPTGQIGFFVSHARDGNDEFVCESHMGADTSTDNSTSTCQENSHTSISSFADDDKMDKSGWMDWNRIGASYRKLSGKTKYYHPCIHRR